MKQQKRRKKRKTKKQKTKKHRQQLDDKCRNKSGAYYYLMFSERTNTLMSIWKNMTIISKKEKYNEGVDFVYNIVGLTHNSARELNNKTMQVPLR